MTAEPGRRPPADGFHRPGPDTTTRTQLGRDGEALPVPAEPRVHTDSGSSGVGTGWPSIMAPSPSTAQTSGRSATVTGIPVA